MKKYLILTVLLVIVPVSRAADKCLIENSLITNIFYSTDDGDDKKLIVKEFKTQSGKTLYLDLSSGGSIEITGWDKQQLNAEFHFPKKDSEKYNLDFEETSDGINIISELKNPDEHQNIRLKVKISLPRKYNIDIVTHGGSIVVENVEGELKGKTMGGVIDLTEIKGNISFKTYGGGVNLSNSEVDGKIETMGGELDVENVKGDVLGSTMGGNVKYKRITSKNSELNLSTMGGNISLDNAANGAVLNTNGGNIDLGSAGKYVKARTMGGNIDIREIDGSLEASTMAGDITATVVEKKSTGEKDIELESMSGDITLIVPENFSMEADLEVSGVSGKNSIVNDFDMKNSRTKREHGSVTLRGEYNGGKNKVRIKTVNGRIFLRRG